MKKLGHARVPSESLKYIDFTYFVGSVEISILKEFSGKGGGIIFFSMNNKSVPNGWE